MERNFTEHDFEDFLRSNADDLRMRPSEKVWQGISKDLHKRRRRIGWGLSAFLVAACTFGYFSLDQQGQVTRTITPEKTAQTTAENPVAQQPTLAFRNEARIADNVSNPFAVNSSTARPNLRAVSPASEKNAASTPDQVNTLQAAAFEATIVDNDVPPNSNTASQPALHSRPAEQRNPLSIESVVNLYKPQKQKKRVSMQWHFAPTMSYRRLTENKSYLRSLQGSSSPNAVIPAHYDVNEMVTHKPGMGLEMGMTAKYPLTQNLRLRAGLQINVTRYEIKAYNSQTEMATIMLNTSSRGADSIYRVSSLSNKGGYEQDWLQNLYFQVSAPIGVEMDLIGSDKVRFGVATTIQPTYILSDKAYLISADYRKYAEVPELTRRWNVNTALETYVAYSTGKLNWQVGPQVRYQLLSSFVSKYPVKENLFDFGLRVGISLNPNNK